jgi:hypothetical protein
MLISKLWNGLPLGEEKNPVSQKYEQVVAIVPLQPVSP